MRRRAIWVPSVLLLAACANEAQDATRFDEFVCRLTGDWDNVEQARADIERNAPESSRHPRRAMTYVPIDAPAIEGQLFAIKNYGEQGFDGEILRVSLHRFRPQSDAIIHEFMFTHDKARWGDLSTSLSTLRDLTEDDVRINTDCAMTWRWQGDHFAGATTPGQCVTSSFTPEPILVEGHGELWARRLVRHDRNFTLDGEALPVPGGDSPELFDRVPETKRAPEC